MLGVEWDPKLLMHDAVSNLVRETRWKVLRLLTSRRYFTVTQLVTLYKSHVLGFVEYRTPALYHASLSVLAPLDRLQEWFLRDLGLTAEEALQHYSLAPLQTRRDIAMLGVVFRAVLRKGPPQLWNYFTARETRAGPTTRSEDRHDYQLETYSIGEHLQVLRRSVFGLVDVFNDTPASTVEASTTVRSFQAKLQALVTFSTLVGTANWKTLLSAENFSWQRRDLRSLRAWEPRYTPLKRTGQDRKVTA